MYTWEKKTNKIEVSNVFASYKAHRFWAPLHIPCIIKATRATQLYILKRKEKKKKKAMLTSLLISVKFHRGILFNTILDFSPVQYLLFKQQEEK